jgi:hypothetical protein
MTNSQPSRKPVRWSRPSLDRDHPVRTAGGFYRTSDSGDGGLAGVPLVAAEDAVVAAVRMAYKVAQAQVDRSTRLARRLRVAGDRAVGPRSDRKAVDAAEELVTRTMMSALTWVEGLSAEGDNPMKRLLLAQYRLVGASLGLMPRSDGPPPASAASPGATGRSAEPTGAADDAPAKSYAPLPGSKVILKGRGRPVRIRSLDVSAATPIQPVDVNFYSSTDINCPPLTAQFEMDARGRATLTFPHQNKAPPGRWRAAICQAVTDEQIGIIEIEM